MKRNQPSDNGVVREQREGRHRFGVNFDLDFPQEKEDQLFENSRNPERRSRGSGSESTRRNLDDRGSPLFGAPMPGRNDSTRRHHGSPDGWRDRARDRDGGRTREHLYRSPSPPYVSKSSASYPSSNRRYPVIDEPAPRQRVEALFGAPPPPPQLVPFDDLARTNTRLPAGETNPLFVAPPPPNISSPSPPPTVGIGNERDPAWKQFVEREKLKEELFKQWEAGLILPSSQQPTSQRQDSIRTTGGHLMSGGLGVGRGGVGIGGIGLGRGLIGIGGQGGIDPSGPEGVDPSTPLFGRDPGMMGFGRELPGMGREQLGIGREQFGIGREQLGIGREQLRMGMEHLGVGRELPGYSSSLEGAGMGYGLGSGNRLVGSGNMMDNILNMVMDTGVRNPSQSNIEFLRTPEMRNLLRKIFMKQSGTRNTSDREFIEQLKKEIKGEPSKVEEVTISSDEDIKKEVSADDLEIIEAPHLRRKKKEMNRKRKSRSRSTSSSLESRSELRKEKKTPPTSRSSAQRSNESREKSDTSGQFRSSQPNSSNRYPVPLSQPPPLPVQSPSKPPKKTSRSPGHKSRSRSRSRSRKRSSRSRSRSQSHSRSKKKSRRKSRSPRTRRHGSPRRDTSPHGRRTKSPHGRKDKSPHGQREKSPHHRRGKSPYNKKREPTPDLFTRRSKERSHDLQKPKTGATQSRVSNEKETKEKVQEKLFASVVGFIDEKTGVLKITSKGKRENQLAIFHKDVLWVMSRNVYTNSMLLEKCVSPCKLETILPMGTGVALTANIINIPGSIFILQASKVWPALGAAPDEIVSEGELGNQLSIFFTTFKLSNYEPLVFDQIEPNNLDIWSVKVAECINEDWGMIEIKSYPKIPGRNSVKMFCFFNKSCIWLKNGTAVSQCNAQRLPLSHLVEINQPVNVVARSVINSKGYSMLVQGQEQVHLQALAVSLDPSCIPAGAPRGVLLPDGPGTFGIDIEQHTSYLFDKTLMEKINLELFKFMKESRKTMANIDFNCVPKAKPTEIKTSSKITHVSRLVSSVARIKKQITPEFGVLENFNKTWSAVFRTADCVLDLDKTYAEEFKEGTKVLMNACLVKEKMRAQYMATSVWIIGTPQSMAMLHKDLSADQLHVYNQVNNILDGRDPNIQQEYFDAEQGEVSDHLDSNFGIINFRAEKAMFNLSEVWLSHESTAANRGLELANVLPRGTKVFLHCLMLNSTTEVKYLATAVWKVHPSPFNSANMPQPIRISSLPKEKIEEFRTRIDQFQIHGIPVPDNPTLNTQPSDPEIFIPDLSRPPPVPLFGAPIPQAQHQMIPVAPMELTHGVVKYGLQRKGDRVLTGGLIEFFPPGPPGVRKPSLAIFSVRSLLNHGGSNLCVPDTRVTFLPIPRSGGVESAVTHIGNLVHLTGYMLPPGVNTKMEADGKEILGQMRHRDLLSLFNTDKKILLYGSSDHSFEQLYDTSALMSAVPPSSHRSVRTITDCVGICAGVFNENFGMIQFRLSDQEFRYCLFDTYDLFVEGGARASENGLGISKITKLGDKVGFHAVEIDATLSMSWLATGVWLGLPLPPPTVHPDTITENKIQVFRQVNSSCSNIIASIKHKMVTGANEAWKTKKMFSCPVASMRLVEVSAVKKFNLPAAQELPSLDIQSSHMQTAAIPPVFMNHPGGLGPPRAFGSNMRGGVSGFNSNRPCPRPQVPKSDEIYDPIDSYTQFFKEKYKDVDVETSSSADKNSSARDDKVDSVAMSRKEELDKMKSEKFYKEYKTLQAKFSNKELLEEPNPTTEMSDGSWEDLLRKWKLQTVVWVKEASQLEQTGSTEDSFLPISLADSSTVAEIVEKIGHFFVVKIVDKNIHALLHKDRIWIIDHKLFEGEAYVKDRFKGRIRVNARRVYITGMVKYQVTFGHCGLVPNQVGAYKYSEKMLGFIKKCQDLNTLQVELEDYMKKKGEKQEDVK